MDNNRQIIGVPAGTLIQLLVDDLNIFVETTGGSAQFSPADPIARMLVLQMCTVPPDSGGLVVSTLASLAPDATQMGIGHVVQMNIATYIVTNVGLPIFHDGKEFEMDFLSNIIKRIMTFGFPDSYTSIIQTFNGYTPIDTSQVSENRNLMAGRIDHSVYIALPGTKAYCCTSISEAGKQSLIGEGWRFGTIV